eukprot:scaffold219200_cov44-Tisochrysis_lutea.AAC.2
MSVAGAPCQVPQPHHHEEDVNEGALEDEDEDYGQRGVYYRGGPPGALIDSDNEPPMEQPAKRPRHDMQSLQVLSTTVQNLAPEAQNTAVRAFFGLETATTEQPTSTGCAPSHRRSSGEVAPTGQTLIPSTPAQSTRTNVFVLYGKRAS